jgi:ketosteroid isomerase-like protein
MIRTIAALVCLIATSAILMGRMNGNDARLQTKGLSDEETVKQLERDSAAASAHNDADATSLILADDFVGNWADGSTTTKKQELDMLRSSKEKYEANEVIEMTVRVFGDTAIASGKNIETSIIDGKNATGTYNFTDIFLKRNGRWRIVASQTARAIPYGAKCL